MKVLRNVTTDVDVTFYTDEAPVDADSDVTVTVTRDSDGTAIATDAPTAHPSTGVYRYTLAGIATLDVLTLVYTGTFGGATRSATKTVEVIGGHIFALAELRERHGLSDTAKFTTEELEDVRAEVDDRITKYTGVAWTPRYAKELAQTRQGRRIALRHRRPRTILSAGYVESDGTVTALDTAGWTLLRGAAIVRYDSWFQHGRTLEIAYEHGADTPPEALRQAAMRAARSLLLGDNSHEVPSRAMSITNDLGNIRLSMPDPDRRPFGIPDVDAVIGAYDERSGIG